VTIANNENLRAKVTGAVASICRPHPDCEPVPDETAIVDAVMAIFEPPYPPPGLELRRVMRAMGLSQVKFAAVVGVSTKHLNQMVMGNVPISYEMVIRLEDATGVPASWWNAAEAAYRTNLLRAVKESWRGPKVLEHVGGSGMS
jgi:plasmid maintenance system antidote protein VapI